MSQTRIVRTCQAVLCFTIALAICDSASARLLLFKTSTGFPFHLAGTGGLQTFAALNGLKIRAAQADYLITLLNSTLFDDHVTLLGVLEGGQFACNTLGHAEEVVLLNALGHLGLALPGDTPAVLLSLPSRMEFACKPEPRLQWQIAGSVIGLITSPGVLASSTKALSLSFAQSEGIQQPTSFLLGNLLFTNQLLLSTIFNWSETLAPIGLAGSATLLATSGTFTIVDE